MADLSITAASVVAGSGARVAHGTAGATITAGQAVYRDASTGKYLLADNDSATAGATEPVGIALNGAASGQPLAVLTKGPVTIGATLTAGTDYWLSSTAGGICPRADLGAGDTAVLIGTASSATVLDVAIQNTGVELAS
jgi:hypothetical protein